MNKQRRVLLKLSGESFGAGKLGIDTKYICEIASQIKQAVHPEDGAEPVQVCIVVGGGNFFRGEELSKAGVDRKRGDYMGMLGTVMNALALQEFLEQQGVTTRVQTAIAMGQIAEAYIPLKAVRHMEKGRVVIFGAGAGMPYFSTDTVSIQRALEMDCECVLMGKNGVDGVYNADPAKDASAVKYDQLSYSKALMEDLKVMDGAALSLARTNGISMRVFGLDEQGNVTKALRGGKYATTDDGKPLGTLVSEEFDD